ncbi:MAG: hypothetical protein GTO24_03475, partial [candidate division Zixibacteria bacterium]|nr:hypothetical protein [candidate division Zixibacteria bacterium]
MKRRIITVVAGILFVLPGSGFFKTAVTYDKQNIGRLLGADIQADSLVEI